MRALTLNDDQIYKIARAGKKAAETIEWYEIIRSELSWVLDDVLKEKDHDYGSD